MIKNEDLVRIGRFYKTSIDADSEFKFTDLLSKMIYLDRIDSRILVHVEGIGKVTSIECPVVVKKKGLPLELPTLLSVQWLKRCGLIGCPFIIIGSSAAVLCRSDLLAFEENTSFKIRLIWVPFIQTLINGGIPPTSSSEW